MSLQPIKLASPAGWLTFRRSDEDQSLYYVVGGSQKEIPYFMDRLPYKPYREYLILDYDLRDDGENWEWSFYTTNKEEIIRKQMENPDQQITRVRITGFILRPAQQGFVGTGNWNNYRLFIFFSKDWEKVEIDFYDKNV